MKAPTSLEIDIAIERLLLQQSPYVDVDTLWNCRHRQQLVSELRAGIADSGVAVPDHIIAAILQTGISVGYALHTKDTVQ